MNKAIFYISIPIIIGTAAMMDSEMLVAGASIVMCGAAFVTLIKDQRYGEEEE